MLLEKFKGKSNYGWINVIAGFLIMATGWAVVYNCAGLFIDPMSSDLNFTRSQINLTVTIRSATQLTVALFAGKIFTKFDIKKLMIVGSFLLFGSYYAVSLVSSLFLIYLLNLITSIAVSLLTTLPFAMIITNWFGDKSGLPIGIAFMGSGIGGMILNPLVGRWISLYGWRTTYQILAFIILIVVLPCTLAIKLRPNNFNSSTESSKNKDLSNSNNIETLTLGDAVRTVKFWAICICSASINISIGSLINNAAPHFSNIGFPITFSANIISIYMFSLAVGKIILGKVFDILTLKKAINFSIIVTGLGILGLILAKSHITLPLFIIFGGIGTAYGTIAYPLIAQKAFPEYHYSSIYGVLAAIGAVGSLISPTLSGITFDFTNSYYLSFYINILLLVICLFLFQLVMKQD